MSSRKSAITTSERGFVTRTCAGLLVALASITSASALLAVPAHAADEAPATVRAHPLDHGPRAAVTPWTAQHMQSDATDQAAPSADTAMALPLDHGPHAQSTPWLNQQRMARELAAHEALAQTAAAPSD